MQASQTSAPGIYRPRQPRASALFQCASRHAPELYADGRNGRRVEENVIGRLLACGDPRHGFARIYCTQCRHGFILAFSYKARDFCRSCRHCNPHIHVLAADGAFDADGGFTVLPPIPRKDLEPSSSKEVLVLLRREGLVSAALAEKMLAWPHTGFSAHNSVRLGARDAAGSLGWIDFSIR